MHEMTGTTIREAVQGDVASVVAMPDDALCVGYVQASQARAWCGSHDDVLLVAVDMDGIVRGFVVGWTAAADIVARDMRLGDMLSSVIAGSTTDWNPVIGVVKTIVVEPSSRHVGIGGMLVDALVRAMSRRGAKLVVSDVWRHDGIENSGPLLSSHGFSSVGIIDGYWADDSIRRGYVCPVCMTIPCTCQADIYVKRVDGTGTAPRR